LLRTIDLDLLLQIPLVEDDRRGAPRLHGELGDAQVLGGDAVAGIAHDERDVGALGGSLGTQRRVVLHGVRHL